MSYLDDCPCKICLVQAVCNESCVDEIIWYSNLTEAQKDKYVESGKYKNDMSKEAADEISRRYNSYLELLARHSK